MHRACPYSADIHPATSRYPAISALITAPSKEDIALAIATPAAMTDTVVPPEFTRKGRRT